jgi:hypothetical protein
MFGVTKITAGLDNYKDDEQMSENPLRIVRNDGSRS